MPYKCSCCHCTCELEAVSPGEACVHTGHNLLGSPVQLFSEHLCAFVMTAFCLLICEGFVCLFGLVLVFLLKVLASVQPITFVLDTTIGGREHVHRRTHSNHKDLERGAMRETPNNELAI